MEKSRKAVIIVIFALMAGGALVPTLFYNTRPEKVVLSALRKLDGDVSFMGVATIGTFVPTSAVAAAGGDPNAQPVPIIFVGEGGMNLPKDTPLSGRAAFVMVGQADEGKDISLDVSATQDGKTYAKLANLPSSGESDVLVKLVNDHWFSMDARTLASLISRNPRTPSTDADNPTGTRPAATWRSLREELLTPGFFGTPFQLALTEMTAAPVKRFLLPMHPGKLVTFSQDIKSLMLGRSLSADELRQVADDMAKRDVTLEVWVNTEYQELAQMQLTIASRNAGSADVNADTDANHFSMVLKFTSWGTPVEVTAPDEFIPYSDLMSAFKKPTN